MMQARNAGQVLLAGVAPAHALEDAGRAALHGQVHVLAHRLHLRHRLDDPVREVVGIRAGEPHPANPRDRAHRPQQVGKVPLTIVIAVHRLAEECHLGHAVGRKPLDLTHDVGKLATPLAAPRHRNDAERASIIAAPLHRDERPHAVRGAPRGNILVVLPGLELNFRRSGPIRRTLDQGREPPVAVGPHHEVHVRRLVQQPGPEALRHAPHDPQDHPGPLVALELAHAADHPLLGIVPHRTGVHQQDVCRGRIVGSHVAVASQPTQDQLGIGHVHLAAVGLDVDVLHDSNDSTGSARSVPSSMPDSVAATRLGTDRSLDR
jgi:hypothetical protein